jgi:hypothetical protein
MYLFWCVGGCCVTPHREAWYKNGHEVCFLDQRKKRARGKFDQIRRLERRIDYLEGVIYQLFQLTERLLKTVEKLDDAATGMPTCSHTPPNWLGNDVCKLIPVDYSTPQTPSPASSSSPDPCKTREAVMMQHP